MIEFEHTEVVGLQSERCTCDECGCVWVFTYDPEDIIKTIYPSPFMGYSRSIECPCCGKEIILEDTK